MKKIIFYMLIIFSFIACNNSKEEINIEFNDQINVGDLLQQPEYRKLNTDEKYKDYLNDFYENSLEIRSVIYKGTEFMAESNFVEADKESDISIDQLFSGISGITSMAMEGHTLNNLKNEKQKLYNSFSDEKILVAEELESKLLEILRSSDIPPENINVKDSDYFLNYKSFGPEIKNDENLHDQLDDLTDKVDQLFLLGFKIRIQQNMNIKLGNNIDKFDIIYNLGTKVLANNGNYPVTISSNLLNKYFKSMNYILEEIQEIESDFRTPIEDWSENKRMNYLFVVEDIKIKLKEDNLSFKLKKINNNEIESNQKEEITSKAFQFEFDETKTKTIESELKLAESDFEDNFESELDILNNRIENNLFDSDAYFQRGIFYTKYKMYKEGIQDYKKVIKLDTININATHNKGIAEKNIGNYSEAIKDFSFVIKNKPNRVNAYLLRGLSYREMNLSKEALEDFNTVIKLDANFDEGYIARGLLRFENNEFETSILDFDKAISLNPNDDVVYVKRGKARVELKNLNGAIEDYSQAIKLNDKNIAAHEYRAGLNLILGHNLEAIFDLNRTIELSPNYSEQYRQRGEAYLNLEQFEKAILDFDKAISINSKDLQAYTLKSSAKVQLKMIPDAIACLDKAIAIDIKESLPDLYFLRGMMKNANSTEGCKDCLFAIKLGFVDESNYYDKNCSGI